MSTKSIDIIEKDLGFKFQHHVEAAHFEYWKPSEMLAYSYTLSKIQTSEVQYELMVRDLKSRLNAFNPQFKLNWEIPAEIRIDWWDPTVETPPNTTYVTFENGWIQTKYECGFIYILKTLN